MSRISVILSVVILSVVATMTSSKTIDEIITESAMSSDDLSRCPQTVPRDANLRAFRESCYQFLEHERSWSVAQSECGSRGGHLVVIKDAATQNFVMNTLRQLHWRRNGVWIGAHDQHRKMDWKWITGERLDYDNWAANQPSCRLFCVEDCGQLRYSEGGRWHDYTCDWAYSFICQFKMLPTTTTKTTTTTTTTTTTPDPVKEDSQVALNVSSVEARPDYELDTDNLWGDNSSRATLLPPKTPAEGDIAEHHSQENVETTVQVENGGDSAGNSSSRYHVTFGAILVVMMTSMGLLI